MSGSSLGRGIGYAYAAVGMVYEGAVYLVVYDLCSAFGGSKDCKCVKCTGWGEAM